MKNTVRLVVISALLLGFLFASAPHQAQAYKIEPTPNIAEGGWTSGSVVDVTTMAETAPDWTQLLDTDGVKVTTPGEICHPLRGGQYGWIGQIMQYKGGNWVSLVTTNGWVPNTEGEFMACADVHTSGTYALFGYYVQPPVVEQPFDCSTIKWSSKFGDSLMVGINVDHEVFFAGGVEGVPEGTTITFRVTSSNPAGFEGRTGSFLVGVGGAVEADPVISGVGLEGLSVNFTESAHGCTSSSNLAVD